MSIYTKELKTVAGPNESIYFFIDPIEKIFSISTHCWHEDGDFMDNFMLLFAVHLEEGYDNSAREITDAIIEDFTCLNLIEEQSSICDDDYAWDVTLILKNITPRIFVDIISIFHYIYGDSYESRYRYVINYLYDGDCGSYFDEYQKVKPGAFKNLFSSNMREENFNGVKLVAKYNGGKLDIIANKKLLISISDDKNIPILNVCQSIINSIKRQIIPKTKIANLKPTDIIESIRIFLNSYKIEYGKRDKVRSGKLSTNKNKSLCPNGWTKTKVSLGYLLKECSKRARNRGDIINIDTEYLDKIFKEQDGKCALTKLNLSFKISTLETVSVDRIDNDYGYIKGNIQLVCVGANYLRNRYTFNEAKDFINKIKMI